MNKNEILDYLIDYTQKEIELLRKSEKEDIKSVSEDQNDENRFENTIEEEVQLITNQNIVLEDLNERLKGLSSIRRDVVHTTVGKGALVKLNTGLVLVMSAFPTVKIGDLEVTGISTQSPIYQKMEGFKKGAEFHLTGHPTEHVVLDIA
ncbi:MAG: hypothetical protein AAFQ94_18665 [Bacteroidota bacterium]